MIIRILLACCLLLMLGLPAYAQQSEDTPQTEGSQVTAEAPQTDDAPGLVQSPYKHNIEWFGMTIGGGLHAYNIQESYWESTLGSQVNPMLEVSVSLFQLNLGHFHATILEMHPTFAVGYLGSGVRLAGRIPLDVGYLHEIRIGSFVGVDMFFTGPGLPAGFALRPYLRYVYNMSGGSVGVGLDVPAMVLFEPNDFASGDGHTDKAFPLAGGALLYFHFTLGRMQVD